MTEAERRALGQTRRLVFQNVVNGVPPEKVRAAMHLSQLEVDQAVQFVRRKITEHLFLRRKAPIPCDTPHAMRWNRKALLGVLARIGDLDLSSDLLLAKITIQPLDSLEMLEGVKSRIAESRS